jgi:hypothetical protein
MSGTNCPCDVFGHPRIISNPPGGTSIDYRAGDYRAFRHALLVPRPGEIALADWHPTGDGDLALQLLEWWAYLGDVLTFYNERAIHEGLLRTAVFPEDIRRVVRLLGYRPRPGIGATGVVAVLADSPRPFVLAKGFPIQGGADPGKPPQVFELDEDIEIGLLGRPLPASARLPSLPLRGGVGTAGTFAGTWTGYAARDSEGRLLNTVRARAKRKALLRIEAGRPAVVGISGVVTLLKPDDTVLIVKRDWDGPDGPAAPPDHALAVVNKLQPSWDELGRAITVVTLHPGETLPETPQRQDYRILKATKLAHLWLYHERYPGMKTPSALGTIAQVAQSLFDPAGLFTGGISTEPRQDPHVLTSQMEPSMPGAGGAAHLEAITRGISPGDPVLFEQRVLPGGLPELFAGMIASVLAQAASTLKGQKEQLAKKTLLAKVMDYSELIWYANAPEGDRIGQGPPIGPPSSGLLSGGAAPIPIPHSLIRFNDPRGVATAMSGPEDLNIGTVVVHYGWQEVGELVDAPAPDETTTPEKSATPEVPAPPEVPSDTPIPVLIEDATGAGVPGWLGITNPEGPPLVSPLRALLNLLPVSRGQTVAGEIVGSGDSILINQEFVLGRAPLTYLTDTGPRSMNGYRSTLRVRVDGIEWHEVATFFGQPSDARVFVTREDDEQKTHIRFGDGEFGARLPSGIDNVVATYRFGSGAEVPRIGSLTTILRPQQGLQAIRNPIAPGGGADPDPPDQIRLYAPRSVLTFGRAVSGDDYETIAAQTPGVRRARVRWTWDADSQRTLVKVFVGDDEAAVVAARTALRAFADPNRPVMVVLAAPRYADISFTLEIDPDYTPDAVAAAVRERLLDPQREPFGTEVVRIDDVVYNSHIYDVCMAVPGVAAVHGLAFSTLLTTTSTVRRRPPPPGFPSVSELSGGVPARETLQRETGERHSAGEGRFYLLRGDCLHISTEIGRHGH